MAKKKHYEYRETYNERREFGDREKSHKLKPNDRWRYNPKEIYNSVEEDGDYDEYEERRN